MRAAGIARTAIAVVVAGLSCASQAAPTAQDKLLAELKRLAERIEKLEKRNTELETKLAAGAAAPAAALAQRVQALEQANHELNASLASDRISENEPELAIRLKAVEERTNSMGAPTKLASALEGITIEGSVAAVAQQVNGRARDNGERESQLSWRGDLGITLPAGDIGRGTGEFFTQLRMGQGDSFTRLNPTFTGAFNSLAFQAGGGSEETYAIVAQAWYQLTTPLGDSANSPHSVQFTAGKMDPFVFFDQNTIADNEAEKFLNNVFVHNPLLDSGGAVGADNYGFTPGMRLAYRNEMDEPDWWQISLAAFGAGEGAKFGRSFDKPFVIGQLEYGRKDQGFDGNYRLYAWRNGQYEGFDGSRAPATGWGASIDQRVHEDVTLFARYGQATSGKAPFDRAVTVGAELTGNAWGRGADSIGLAWGWLRASKDFRREAAGLLDDEGNFLFGYTPSGAEQVAELYYRWHLNDQLSLTPDLQYVRRAAANRDAKNMTAFGVRALYAF
ncbi:carbohydrate porin [Aromatoleum petrolei]|uniref:Carbohydrate porin n=1 Tax=Aromatoleum petrolei TaxID=76116 RepID=A0ABX1MTA3_9RHOO|nr:carbohydrate porin [Aromatoleum petrolei]NMF91208.1 carbohydrate porin [Aromatoleum petrolei]QTQ36019.1 Carbohydrate-selective porin family protein, OprB-like [Aromatoleum petrolei]